MENISTTSNKEIMFDWKKFAQSDFIFKKDTPYQSKSVNLYKGTGNVGKVIRNHIALNT